MCEDSIKILNELAEVFEEVHEAHTWRLCVLSHYSATRWLGIIRCVERIIGASAPLMLAKQNLIEQDYGPPAEKTAVQTQAEQQAAHQEHTGKKQEKLTCDLCRRQYCPNGTLMRGDKSSQLRALDTPSVGNTAATLAKRDTLLSARTGFTDANLGMATVVYSVLAPYKVMTERLQTVPTPEYM